MVIHEKELSIVNRCKRVNKKQKVGNTKGKSTLIND